MSLAVKGLTANWYTWHERGKGGCPTPGVREVKCLIPVRDKACILRNSSKQRFFFFCCAVPVSNLLQPNWDRICFPHGSFRWHSVIRTTVHVAQCNSQKKKTLTESLGFSSYGWFLLIKTTTNYKFSPRVVISSNSLLALCLPWSLLSTHSARHCTRVFLIFSSNVASQCCGRGDAGITDNSGITSSSKPSIAVTCRRCAEVEKAYIVKMTLFKAWESNSYRAKGYEFYYK